ncbi:hypothetical protein LMG33818_001867 [Halomonadaceae bacterium LMG 33818]|uniref:hypothetical protein n=1 Tax=Cernens ardua TaxID=3402176 RepID=UPI003EDC6344
MESAKGLKLGLWPFLVSQAIIALVTASLFSTYQGFLDNSTVWWVLSVLYIITVTPRLTDSGLPQIVSLLFSVSSLVLFWCLRLNIEMVLIYSGSIWLYAAMIPSNFMQQIAAEAP